eukprot:78823-Chlamydomonas_euryale.AAC.6
MAKPCANRPVRSDEMAREGVEMLFSAHTCSSASASRVDQRGSTRSHPNAHTPTLTPQRSYPTAHTPPLIPHRSHPTTHTPPLTPHRKDHKQ